MQAPPPQSESVSAPDCTPSVHDASWQIPSTHWFPAQSLFTTQVPPGPQPGQVPPQSTPVSPSSLIRLAQCSVCEGPPSPPPLVSSNLKLGTEQEAAIKASTARARGSQCFGDVERNACNDAK